MKNNYIPKGYYQDDSGELYDAKGTMVSSASPMVEKLKKVKKRKGKVVDEKIVINWLGANGRNETQEISAQDIRDGTFIKKLPTSVIVDPSYSKKIRDIFRYIILSQMMNKESEDVEEHEFGWNGLHYYWEIEEEQKGYANSEYEVAVSIADILSKGEDAISAMLLAAIHGPLIKVLREAGINQDFLTLIVGESGVGKTELAKIFCDYLPYKKVVFSLGSKRGELQKKLERIADITCVIDDYNLTASNRVKERQLQILSEIIQSRSNAGKLLVDADSEQYEENEVHVVATSETIIHNVSSLNRCFLVQMDTPIENGLWKKNSKY